MQFECIFGSIRSKKFWHLCKEGCNNHLRLFLCSYQVESRASVNHFGRSLLGGYCPQYMPDFALHGISSDLRLKQCLMADLEHTVLVSTITVNTAYSK